MRKVVFALVGLLALAKTLPAQEVVTGWAGKMLAVEGKAPSGHDFGSVPRGAQLKHRFPITNIYAVPLQVVTRVSCDCVSVTTSTASGSAVLQPRESGTLDINMDTLRFHGHKAVTVYVTVMNQQYASTTTLQITGHCRTDVMLEPGQAVFGVVPRGQPATREVVIRYFGHLAWQIKGMVPGDRAPFDVTVKEAYRQPGQVGYRVALTLKPDAPAGSLKGDLHLTTNDPASPHLPVPYDVLVQAPLNASPAETRFGTVKAGEAAPQRKIMVRGNRPFRITGVDGQDGGLTVEYGSAAAVAQVLTIKLTPTQPGPFQRTLTIRTDLDNGAATTAKVEATVQ